MEDSLVELVINEGIATLTLNDGRRMNPLGEQMIADLISAMDALGRDDTLRALIVTARGKGFCVGADLADYLRWVQTPSLRSQLGTHVGEMLARMNPVIEQLRALHVPVVSAVNGAAAGGGVGLALAADLVLAAESAYFYLPFVPTLGIVPDMGATWALPRAIGSQRALGLALTGKKLGARQAADWGLIWECVPDAALASTASELANQLAAIPPGALVEARAIFRHAASASLADQLALERDRQTELVAGEPFIQAVRAFAARRKT